MVKQNQKSVVVNEHKVRGHHYDEVDLVEVLRFLWAGKKIIIVTTLLFSLASVLYGITAPQWWSSVAKVTEAQPQNISSYHQQVKQFQPIFDIYQEDGTVRVSHELDELVDTRVLFERFIDAFNSSNNKREFLKNSEDFAQLKKSNQLSTQDSLQTPSNDTERRLYSDWLEKVFAEPEDKKLVSSPYNLQFQATTKEDSFILLNAYIESVVSKVKFDAFNNLQALVDGKRNELIQQKFIFESQAKNLLEVETERAKYSLDIASKAGVDGPIQTNSGKEVFAIDLGSKALAAKVNALESLKNLSVIEPRLQQVNAKLNMLESLKINRNIDFQTFRFLEDVERPISRDEPKRSLIAILGTFLGGFIGLVIVLFRFVLRDKI